MVPNHRAPGNPEAKLQGPLGPSTLEITIDSKDLWNDLWNDGSWWGPYLVDGWALPSGKYEFVSWDDDIPNMMEKIKNVPNHQPDRYIYIYILYNPGFQLGPK